MFGLSSGCWAIEADFGFSFRFSTADLLVQLRTSGMFSDSIETQTRKFRSSLDVHMYLFLAEQPFQFQLSIIKSTITVALPKTETFLYRETDETFSPWFGFHDCSRTVVTFLPQVSPLLHQEPSLEAATFIEVYGDGLEQAVTTKPAQFSVNLQGADKEDLEIHGQGPDGRLLVTVKESAKDPRTCDAFYTPQNVGEHEMHVSHAGVPVAGSPFTVKVADPGQVKIKEPPKKHAPKNEVDILVEVPQSAGDGQLEASVQGPDLQSLPTTVSEEDDGYHHIRFVPKEAGEHKVRVLYAGQEVSGSPCTIQVHETTTAKVKPTEQITTGYRAKREVSGSAKKAMSASRYFGSDYYAVRERAGRGSGGWGIFKRSWPSPLWPVG